MRNALKSYVIWVVAACTVSLPAATGQGLPDPILVTVTGSGLAAYSVNVNGATTLWTVGGALSRGPYVVPDNDRAIVLVGGASDVRAFDAEGGALLWTINSAGEADFRMEIGTIADAYRQFYTNEIVFPYGPPRFQGAPLVVITDRSSTSTTIRLVDSRTGAVHWSPTFLFDAEGAGFVRTAQGSYDVLLRGLEGGSMGRLDGATGTQRWLVAEDYRTLIPIGDLTGDGECDLVSRKNYWPAPLKWYDGMTGAQLNSTDHGSFDILGVAVVPGDSSMGCEVDLICAAQGCTDQGGGGGLFRRSACPQTPTIEWDSTGYCNQTMLGLIRRGPDWTVLSGWRHQNKVIAVDAMGGTVLWVVDSTAHADHAAIGATDLTGDGNDDVFITDATGLLRLHDGLTGAVVPTFSPLGLDPDRAAAVWVRETVGTRFCFGDGTGTPCPCANPGGPMEGCANRMGHGGRLTAIGSTSVTAGDLELKGSNLVPSLAGLYFQGDVRVNGGNGLPFGDGLRCAGANVVRLQVRFANGAGESSTSIDIAASGGVSPGDTRTYQLWYRDTTGPCGTGFNLTNGLEITWNP